MKKTILFAMALLWAYATTFAQSKTPSAVRTAFNQKFPDATKIKWDKENAQEYEAEFKWKGVNYIANFTENGNWLETESPISFNQLPDKVQKAYNMAHKGAPVKAVAKIETVKNATKYEVEFKQSGKTVELFYTNDGTEVKE